MLCKKPIPAYTPTDEDLEREWTGKGARQPLPPIRGKREALSERGSFGNRVNRELSANDR